MNVQSDLPRLRLQQLKDLARAYGIRIPKDGTKPHILPLLQAAELDGVFMHPPKNPYYFERAKWSPDLLKEAKIRGGFIQQKVGNQVFNIPVPVLYPWTGPDPEADVKAQAEAAKENVTYNSKNRAVTSKNASEMGELRRRCKELGITWPGGMKPKAWMQEQIAIAEGKMTKPE